MENEEFEKLNEAAEAAGAAAAAAAEIKEEAAAETENVTAEAEEITAEAEEITAEAEEIAAEAEAGQTAEAPAPQAEEPLPAAEPEAAPCWTYAAQAEADRKARKKTAGRGALIYALVMTGVFCVTLGILVAILLTGYGSSGLTPGNGQTSTVILERTVFVREGEAEFGTLTVAEVYEKVCPSVVGISVELRDALGQVGTGTGTGVIYTEDGYIITNYHVIENSTSITVVLPDRTRHPATLVGGHADSDIAVVKIDAHGLTPAEFGDSDQLIVGDRVAAIGNPSGLEYFDTLTVGYVSAVNRAMNIYDTNGYLVKRMIMTQTDTPLNPGNSGGPLVNMEGEVIGINTMKLNETEALGFAIQSNGARTVADALIATGSYNGNAVTKTGVSLGISCIAVKKGETVEGLTPTLVAPESGVAVVSVTAGRSAEGYLKVGDIITKIDGFAIYDVEEMRERLFDHSVGETVTLTVARGSGIIDVVVPLK